MLVNVTKRFVCLIQTPAAFSEYANEQPNAHHVFTYMRLP